MPRTSLKRGGGNKSIGGFKKNTGISAARKGKREDGASTSTTPRISKKQKVKADEPPAAAAAEEERKPSAYRREQKTIRVTIKAEDGTDTLSEAIVEEGQPLLDDKPPDEWVEGGKQRNSKGEEKTIYVLTVDNAFEMHPILNSPSKKKALQRARPLALRQ